RVHGVFFTASTDREKSWELSMWAEKRSVTEMTMLDWQTFVLQRRINRPSAEVLHAISNPAVFGSGSVLSSDADGALRLEEPFRRVARLASPVWRANARLD